MAEYNNWFDALRAGESAEGASVEDILAGSPNARNDRPVEEPLPKNQVIDLSELWAATDPANKASQSSSSVAQAPARTAPSQSVEDANAFIRANRDGKGNQIASLLQGPAAVKGTSVDGVRAIVQADGSIELTNVGGAAQSPNYPSNPTGAGPGSRAVAPNTPLAVNSLLANLQQTNDVDTARGIAAQLRNASAVEQSKYETQAIKFAETQLGIPKLQADLQGAIALDMADPKYQPGMGDSSKTLVIRNTLEDARIKAQANSKTYLNNNADYAVLKASLATADAEVARITRIGDRKTALEEGLQARTAEAKYRKDEQASDLWNTLDSTSQQRVGILSPELARMSPDDLSVQGGKIVAARAKTDKAYAAAVQAPEDQLPLLALNGNAYANTLVIAKETKNTGDSPSVVQGKLNDLRMMSQNPKFDKEAEKYFTSSGDTKSGQKAFKDYQDLINSKSLDKDSKEQKAQIRFQMALQMQKKKTTIDFANNLDDWKITPEVSQKADEQFPAATALFSKAVKETRQVTSGARMLDTLNSFLGDSDGAERIQKGKAFVQLMAGTAQTKQDSIFGTPDARALRSQIEGNITKGFLARWMDGVQRSNQVRMAENKAAGRSNSPFGTGVMQGDLLGLAADKGSVDLSPTDL